jgi:hypothetical protein
VALSTWYCGVFEWCGVGLPCKFRLIDCFSNYLVNKIFAGSITSFQLWRFKKVNRQKVWRFHWAVHTHCPPNARRRRVPVLLPCPLLWPTFYLRPEASMCSPCQGLEGTHLPQFLKLTIIDLATQPPVL